MFDAHRGNPEFRYGFLAHGARDEREAMADRTAWRICSSNGWWRVFGKKRRNDKRGEPGTQAFGDLVRRNLIAPAPNTPLAGPLGRLTLIEYEAIMAPTASQAT